MIQAVLRGQHHPAAQRCRLANAMLPSAANNAALPSAADGMEYSDRQQRNGPQDGAWPCYEATFRKAFQTALSIRLVIALICAPGPSSTCMDAEQCGL